MRRIRSKASSSSKLASSSSRRRWKDSGTVFRYSNGRLIARRHGARDKDDAPAETDAALRVADNAGASLVVYVLRRYTRVKVVSTRETVWVHTCA